MNTPSDRSTWKRPFIRRELHQLEHTFQNTLAHRGFRRASSTSNRTRRVCAPIALLGVALMLVIGMSSSGVAASSQPTGKGPKIGDGVQVTRPNTREERVGQEALGLITYDWRSKLPGWRITFLPARKGYLALTYRVERRIDVYVRMDRPVAGVAHDISHEIGHALDVTYFGDGLRGRYLELRNLPADSPWWACNSCRDLSTGAGDFAEVFALHAAPRFKFYSDLGVAPTAEELAAIISEIVP